MLACFCFPPSVPYWSLVFWSDFFPLDVLGAVHFEHQFVVRNEEVSRIPSQTTFWPLSWRFNAVPRICLKVSQILLCSTPGLALHIAYILSQLTSPPPLLPILPFTHSWLVLNWFNLIYAYMSILCWSSTNSFGESSTEIGLKTCWVDGVHVLWKEW